MSQDEIPCSKCGQLVRKDLTYCDNCGALLETRPLTPTTPSIVPFQPSASKKPPKTKKNFPYQTLTFFIVVGLIDLLVSFLIMNGFLLPASAFGQLYLIFFFIVTFSLGLFWLAIKYGDFSGGSVGTGLGGCGLVIGAGIGIAIGVPMMLIPIFSTIATEIGDAITESISNAFTDMFADVEIPGFEPLLFLGLFAMLSIIIMYRYHLKTKKNSLSN